MRVPQRVERKPRGNVATRPKKPPSSFAKLGVPLAILGFISLYGGFAFSGALHTSPYMSIEPSNGLLPARLMKRMWPKPHKSIEASYGSSRSNSGVMSRSNSRFV